MLFIYVRHGDPIYDPDSLTPLGERQAESVGRRLAQFGVDKIYASTSNRAILTARPLCDMLGKEPVLLDFCNESHAAEDFYSHIDGVSDWAFRHPTTRALMLQPEVVAMGQRWYEHPSLAQFDFGKGVRRVYDGLDELFASLGYEHERGSGWYRAVRENDDRVALFAHQGFGNVFMSCLLDIPYPMYATHFDMTHSGMTVIDFHAEKDGLVYPRVLTLSDDGHLFRDGLPTRYSGDPRCQF